MTIFLGESRNVSNHNRGSNIVPADLGDLGIFMIVGKTNIILKLRILSLVGSGHYPVISMDR